MERINITVDKLAKLGLIEGITEGDSAENYYPFEQIRVSIKNEKVTGKLKSAFNQHWSHKTARQFYHEKKNIHRDDFELVYGDDVEQALHSFPQRFRDFVTKQVSKFCGTNNSIRV